VGLEGPELFVPVGLDLVQPGPHGGNGLVTQPEDPHPGVLVTPLVSDDSHFEQHPEVFAHGRR